MGLVWMVASGVGEVRRGRERLISGSPPGVGCDDEGGGGQNAGNGSEVKVRWMQVRIGPGSVISQTSFETVPSRITVCLRSQNLVSVLHIVVILLWR
jgi:hypothetical protein